MRKAFVGVTDHDWYEFLSHRPDLTEVNFWQPGGKVRFKALAPGALPELDSEAIDFRPASESFVHIRRLARRELETLRLMTVHHGWKVPTVGGVILCGRGCQGEGTAPG